MSTRVATGTFRISPLPLSPFQHLFTLSDPAFVTGMFADPEVAYLHAHNARPGCYSCRIDRIAG